MSDFMDSFPQLLKVFVKDSSAPFSVFDASLAGETCLTQGHTSLPRQPESTHAFISSNSCQPKGHASCRTPYGAHSTSSSAPSCFFPFPSTDVDLKITPCETPCMLISISEPASRGTQPTTTYKVQSLFSGVHSHVWWYFHSQGLHFWGSASTQPCPLSTPSTWSSKTLAQRVSPLNKVLSTQ